MLKKFFTVFLGSMAAIWLSIALMAGVVIITLFSLLSSAEEPQIKDSSILYFDLSGQVNDRYTPAKIQDILIENEIPGSSLDEMLQALGHAKTDSRIKGVYLDLGGAQMEFAKREELQAALLDFKKTGKWVYAYSDSYGQGDYFTASVADKIFINPTGQMDIFGMAVSVPFFKNALNKLGVEVQVVKVGTFKSAVEPFILTEMSEPARLQYQVLLDSIWNYYATTVVKNIGLPADSVSRFKEMASSPMMTYTVDELVKSKLVTAKAYRYEVEKELRTKAASGDELNLITPRDYLTAYQTPETMMAAMAGSKRPHIAVVYAVGDIVVTGKDGIVSDQMAPMIIKLADDDNVKGLVLRVNSGGGSAFASEQIWAALEYFKSKGKPFYTSMGGTAASGGYYISCGADKIFADNTTVTGSIGIFGLIPYAQNLLNDKLGINFSVVETNDNALFPRLDSPLTQAQYEALEKNVRAGYDLFVSRVAKGRKMTDENVRKIAEGRIWGGSMAKEIGLVDQIGGLQVAMADMVSKTGLTTADFVNYPLIKLNPLTLMIEAMADSDKNPYEQNSSSDAAKVLRRLGASAKQVAEYLEILDRIKSMGTIQAKAEDITIK